MNRRLPFLALFAILPCSATTITTYYSQSAFDNALKPGTESITESFSGNQINTPGLTISVCGETGQGSRCAPVGTGAFFDDRSSFANNQFSDVVGKLSGISYSQVFTLPNQTTSVGFLLNEDPNPFTSTNAAFLVAIGDTRLAPFGGFETSNPGLPNPSTPYDGFVGFVSDTPFDTFGFSSAFIEPASYTMGDITFAVPEPDALAFTGIGLIALFAFKLKRSC